MSHLSHTDWATIVFVAFAGWGFIGAAIDSRQMWRLGVMGMLVMIALAAQGIFAIGNSGGL